MKTVAMRKAAKANNGGPGKGKKKIKPYSGPTVIERPGKPEKRFKKGDFEKMKGFDKALREGIIKKTQRGYKYVK